MEMGASANPEISRLQVAKSRLFSTASILRVLFAARREEGGALRTRQSGGLQLWVLAEEQSPAFSFIATLLQLNTSKQF
jgi:hypothetical protein